MRFETQLAEFFDKNKFLKIFFPNFWFQDYQLEKSAKTLTRRGYYLLASPLVYILTYDYFNQGGGNTAMGDVNFLGIILIILTINAIIVTVMNIKTNLDFGIHKK